MTRVVLHVDRLVLHGVRVDDLRSFAAGLEEELTRVLDNSSTLRNLRAGGVHERPQRNHLGVSSAASADGVGRCVARGIAGALTP